MAKQKTVEQIAAEAEKAAFGVDEINGVKRHMTEVDARTLTPEARGAWKEAKANVQQALSAQRAVMTAKRAELKVAQKA